jgi:hypothetical protein
VSGWARYWSILVAYLPSSLHFTRLSGGNRHLCSTVRRDARCWLALLHRPGHVGLTGQGCVPETGDSGCRRFAPRRPSESSGLELDGATAGGDWLTLFSTPGTPQLASSPEG